MTSVVNRMIGFVCVITILTSSCKKDCNCIPPVDDPGKNINDGLWAYYPIKGSLADSSGHNHALVLNAGAALTSDKGGNPDGAINFDGVNDYGIITDGGQFPGADYSVSFWVLARANQGLFFGKHDYSTGKSSTFNVGMDNAYFTDKVRFYMNEDQSQVCDKFPNQADYAVNPTAFNPNAWYHVAITFAAGSMKLYVNGNLADAQSSVSGSIATCSTAAFVLADWWSGGHVALNGKMDEIRIYTRAITQKEVQYLFDKK